MLLQGSRDSNPFKVTFDGSHYFLYYVVVMAKGDTLGEFEHIVLLALVRLRDHAYGMRIRQEIEKRTGRDVSIGSVYTTLERLEAKGYVSSWMGEPTAERGGRAKRYFRLEAAGMAVLSSTEEVLRRMRQGVRVTGTAT